MSTYPQINDLYLAADLLITDYSSMMFDYSVTRRPMIFFTPDFDEYTNPKVRGVYFDLEEVAAGPVVRTPKEVVELLGSIDSWTPTYAERYEAWALGSTTPTTVTRPSGRSTRCSHTTRSRGRASWSSATTSRPAPAKKADMG